MNIPHEIYQLIRQTRPVLQSIEDQTNLYTDLGFDSISFISLLVKIEETFQIKFSIIEMGQCVIVGTLTAVVLNKIETGSTV